ncbi:MAG: hypothetical protein AAGF11_11990 [Myxococcota bacterium]
MPTRGGASGRARRAILRALLTAGACHPTPPAAPEPSPTRDPFADQPYADAPLPEATKLLLVAGGDDVANFAAEVVEQRALWIEAGLQDDEIACYYAKPTRRSLDDDGPQWRALAPKLRECYPADPETIHAHLRAIAARSPPFVYLFVTSHGLPPLLRWAAEIDDPNELLRHFELRPGEIGRFDRHAIGLEAGDGPGLGEVEALLAAHRHGAETESLLLTPDTLANALAELPPSSERIVVLQACFSGGFIGRPEDDGPSPLTRLPRTTVLTATDPDHPSFGCGAGAQRTYYGGTFNRVLADALERAPDRPPALPWNTMHERIRFVVETMEVIDGETPSHPWIFSNVDGSPTRTDPTDSAR